MPPVPVHRLPPDADALTPLLADLSALKRLRGAAGESFAAYRFRAAWAALADGVAPAEVAATELVVAAAQLSFGTVDAAAMAEAGVAAAERVAIHREAAERALGPLEPPLRDALDRVAEAADEGTGPHVPRFADRLAAAPTAPVRPLPPVLVTEFDDFDAPSEVPPVPDETVGEHSWFVAVAAGLLARARGDDIAAPVLLALAHHTEADDLDELDAALGEGCRDLLADPGPDTAAGAAFAAAHIVDRVLQQRHYANDAGLSLLDAAAVSDLVGHGPLAAFEAAVLRHMGLAF